MEDTKMGVRTVAEMMEEDDHKSKRALVQIVAAILIGIGLLFTFALNVMLYSRPFEGSMKVIGAIPAVLIEGSLAVFLVGNFVWFSHGTQGTLAKVFGWFMFAIVALNCVVEFNTLLGAVAADNAFLEMYRFWGVPVIIPLVVGFWKAILDSDVSISIMRKKRKIQQALQIGKMDSYLAALDTADARLALTMYGRRGADETNAKLRGDLIDGTVKQVKTPEPVVQMAKDASAEAGQEMAEEELQDHLQAEMARKREASASPKSKAAK